MTALKENDELEYKELESNTQGKLGTNLSMTKTTKAVFWTFLGVFSIFLLFNLR